MGNINPKLNVNIGKLEIKNPVMTASGTFGYGKEFEPFVDLNQLGAIVVKGLSLLPTKGNPPERIAETPCGMLNAIGLENVGLDVFIDEKLPFLRQLKTPLIVNIYGKTEEEYQKLAQRIDALEEVAAMEVNISCPNVKAGGIAFGTDPKAAYNLTQMIRKATKKPLIVKLSPNVTDITVIAKCVEDAGADSVSLINTITGMAIDVVSRKPKLANITGGLSGPAIKPIALRMVWQVANTVKIPVIGMGGIMSAIDALEFMIAGATAVQIGTANFINPATTTDVLQGMIDYLRDNDINNISDIIGSLKI